MVGQQICIHTIILFMKDTWNVGRMCPWGYGLGITCDRINLQLRGQAAERQVPNAKIALQHNLGLGGAVVVALYKLYHQPAAKKMGSIDDSTK